MEAKGEDRAHWARVAAEWTAWARAPGHDAFWSYRSALASFVSAPTTTTASSASPLTTLLYPLRGPYRTAPLLRDMAPRYTNPR